MKRLILTALILCPFFCLAQNYNCFENNARHYFTNDIHYLRGITIDSIKVSGGDTTYYPFKTNRLCSLCDNGSWLGGRVIKKANGTHLFNTKDNDTVIIKTQAQPGDSWMFYDDASFDRYVAEVVASDTMTFIGILDSVKRIRLTAYHLGTINPSDSLHNREIYISMNHGFVKVFDLYTFPYRVLSSDINLNHVGTGTFTICDYHPPTKLEIYDFSPGDAFMTSASTYSVTYSSSTRTKTYDSVVAKTVIDPFHTRYTIQKWQDHEGTSGSGVTYHYFNHSTYYLDADTSLLMTTNMPESLPEFLMDYFYNPNDTSYCTTGKRYTARLYIPFEGCDQGYSYKTGFEQCMLIDNTPLLSEWPGCHEKYSSLAFSIKNGVNCGPYPGKPNAVMQMEIPIGLQLFPNPAVGKLTIAAAVNISSVVIRDIPGRIVFAGKYNAKNVEVDISNLPNGLFIAQINDIELRKIVKQ